MKLTYRQIEFLTSSKVVQNVIDKAAGVFGLDLYRVMSKVQQEAEPFRKQFQKVINEYGQKDENGNVKLHNIEGQQTISIIPGKEAEATAKIEELRDREIEILVEPIVFSVEDNLTTRELLALSPILKEI